MPRQPISRFTIRPTTWLHRPGGRSSKVRMVPRNLALCIILCGLTGAGCMTTTAMAPLIDATRPPHAPVSPPSASQSYHLVKSGETLYSIAWQYGLNYQTLSLWNQIPPPYRIGVGQRIALQSGFTRPAVAQYKTPPPSKPKAQTKPWQPRPERALEIAKTPEPARSSVPLPRPPKGPVPPPSKSPTGWLWPTKGRVIAAFSETHGGNKGINISGSLGQPVIASGQGSVVYAGNGLRQYGNMIIIKHDEAYLSAYAHTQKNLVKEGDAVASGQTIASMGNTGTDQAMLHFEIRKNGKPINPARLLPKTGP